MKSDKQNEQSELFLVLTGSGLLVILMRSMVPDLETCWLHIWFYLAAGSVAMLAALITVALQRVFRVSATNSIMTICLIALTLITLGRLGSIQVAPARLLVAGQLVGQLLRNHSSCFIIDHYLGLFLTYLGIAFAVECPVVAVGFEVVLRYWRLKHPAPEPTRGERCRSFRLDEFRDYAHPGFLLLGKDRETGRDFLIPTADLNVDSQLTGTTGSGKTTLIIDLIRQWPGGAIVYDGKGDADLCRRIYADAIRKTFHHPAKTFRGLFLNSTDLDKSSTYNPLIGDAHSQAAMLKQSFSWSEEFYEKVSERRLLEAARALNKEIITVAELAKMIDPFDDSTRILLEQIRILTLERFYPWMDTLMPEMRLENAFLHDEVLVFSIANDIYGHSAEFLTHLVIQDLKQTASRLVKKGKPTLVIIDEASVILKSDKNAEGFVQFINKVRSAGGCVVVSTQSIGDYSEEFRESLSGNLRTKIVGASAENATPEYFANLFGTRGAIKKTLKADEDISGLTTSGEASLREVREFSVHPDDLKKLTMGQWVVLHNKRTLYIQSAEVKIEPRELPDMPLPVAIPMLATQPTGKPINSNFN